MLYLFGIWWELAEVMDAVVNKTNRYPEGQSTNLLLPFRSGTSLLWSNSVGIENFWLWAKILFSESFERWFERLCKIIGHMLAKTKITANYFTFLKIFISMDSFTIKSNCNLK